MAPQDPLNDLLLKSDKEKKGKYTRKLLSSIGGKVCSRIEVSFYGAHLLLPETYTSMIM